MSDIHKKALVNHIMIKAVMAVVAGLISLGLTYLLAHFTFSPVGITGVGEAWIRLVSILVGLVVGIIVFSSSDY